MNEQQLIQVIAVLVERQRYDLVQALQDNEPLFTEVGEAAKKLPEVKDFKLTKAITTSLRLQLKDGGVLGINYVGKKLSFIPIDASGKTGKTEVYRVTPSKMNADYLMKLITDHFRKHQHKSAASVA